MLMFFKKHFIIIFFIIGISILLISSKTTLAQDAFEQLGAYNSQGLAAGEKGFADGAFVEAICDIFSLMGNELGALLTSAALLAALVYAAIGGFGQSIAAVIVAVSAFAMTSAVSLYFGVFSCS